MKSKFSKKKFHIYIYPKNSTQLPFWPHPTSEVIIWTNLHLNYLKMLLASWPNILRWFLRWRIFLIISPLRKAWPFTWTNLNYPGALEKKMKLWNISDNNNNTMRDNRQIAIRKAHMSLRIRGAKTEKKKLKFEFKFCPSPCTAVLV